MLYVRTSFPLKSLSACLNHLQNPETPNLLRAAIPTLIQLINITTTLGSAERFDKLCTILGDRIIGSIWIYAAQDADTVLATVDVLPDVIYSLGIGCARYLKV